MIGQPAPRAEHIQGVIAASVTPLAEWGEELDEAAVEPLVDFLAAAGVDGILALGTTGEGILLDSEERRRTAERFVAAGGGRLKIVVHCGAQTTAGTARLAAHAAEIGADAVAVIAPPYFVPDETALLTHFQEAARACAPLPFYLYEFSARAGYAIPLPVIAELSSRAANLAGLKISDTPWERFERYLLPGLDAFVGPEMLIDRGLAAGAVGAVSALAAALPELVVEAVRNPCPETAGRASAARAALEAFPFHSALKLLLARRGVPVREDVRGPLRILTPGEKELLEATFQRLLGLVEVGH